MKSTKNNRPKALALFSGGLDSILAIKIIQEQNINVEAVFFKLPFIKKQIPKLENIKIYVLDCTKGKLFQEYLNIIRSPKYGIGSAINPCLDCKIFMFEKAKQLAKKINADFIITGEVLAQRPMSQFKHALLFDDKKAGLTNKILRPLSAKLLPETDAEKKGLVNRNKLLDIQGRQRKKQIQLAKRYNLKKYPSPSGGCLLCESVFAKRLKDLLDNQKQIKPKEVELLRGFRHFRKNKKIILGRNNQENEELIKNNKKLNQNILIPKIPGPVVLYQSKQDKTLAQELQKAYTSKDLNLRKKFAKFKI